MDYKPSQLVVRCYAEKIGDQWQALCVDLTLASQADTFEEAKEKLEEMILDYVYDAMVGEDKDFGPQLLMRKAHLRYRLKFRIYSMLANMGALGDGFRRRFVELLPLIPNSPLHT